ncbi:MAG: glycosyltransferase family 2 protein [Ilumatobacter sp.]|uniref:glycosyltransferase family 2 protein n=1 Tax=Ilumatobacter sp. TaxID=1967498 RepID=UPI003299B313
MSGTTSGLAAARLVRGSLISVAVGISAIPSSYLVTLSCAAYWSSAGRRRPSRTAPSEPSTKFVVLIPAHDEAVLIAETVERLMSAAYPAELLEVHVIADHCTDETAAIARRGGAIVHEHDDPEPRGKGASLRWAIADLLDRDDISSDDVVVVVDADSGVDSGFFSALDSAFDDDVHVVQAYYTVRSPGASTATSLRYAALAARHFLRPLGRTALGSSSGLFGNGMGFRVGTLSTLEISDHLTEDLELGCQLALGGVTIAFAPDARLEAEMPDSIDGSTTQHERWERGRIELARRFVPQFLRPASGRGRPIGIGQRLDATLDLLTPPLSVAVALSTLTAAATGIDRACRPTSACARARNRIAIASLGGHLLHVIAALVMVGAPAQVYRSLLRAPRLVVWKVVLWSRMVIGGSEIGWTRTERNTSDRI